ncbi:MAG TPA: NEW3 domain-containing protein [Dehalococcoidales bacterium]|nr:NEW3 domain-containing protein [Dehalococcoidales bacterium]
MNKLRAVRCLFCFVLLCVMLGGLAGGQVLAVTGNSDHALALPPSEEESSGDVVELRSDYPVISGKSGDAFELEVEVMWRGDERQIFDLAVTPPSGWKATIFSGSGRYPEVKIGAMVMEPGKFYGNKVKIKVEPLPGNMPEPGDYPVIFEASSGDIRETIELTAKVTARYEFAMRTPTSQLNTEATAGKDNNLTVLLVNSGSDPVENLSLTSIKPEGWDITYEPEKVDSLAPGATQELDVVIKPPKETIAGDWSVTLQANSEDVSDKLDLRITVLTPTIWGWVGILIVVLVIAGVGVVFWRLGRR